MIWLLSVLASKCEQVRYKQTHNQHSVKYNDKGLNLWSLLRNNILFGSCHDALRKTIDFDLAIGNLTRKKFCKNTKRK